MQITLDLNTATVPQVRGLIALLSSVCPAAFLGGVQVLGAGADAPELDPETAFTGEPTAERVFAAAPAPDGLAPDGAPIPPASSASAGVAETVAGSEGAAPAGTSAPVAAAPERGDLDADGVPWDARIHSEGKAKSKEGKWRLKRGVTDETRAAIKAELLAAMAAPPPPAGGAEPVAVTPPPPPIPAAPAPVAEPAPSPVPPPPPPATPAPAAAETSPPVAAPVATQAEAAPPAPVSGAAAFGALMRKVSPAQAEGKITAAQTTELVQSLGLQNLRDLVARPDLIPDFEGLFDGFVSAA